MDQTGSLGYPNSLGASYMESYMASRPLSVRMAAAEKAGLSEEEKARLVHGSGNDAREREAEDEMDARQNHSAAVGDDDDMDIIGNMEDF